MNILSLPVDMGGCGFYRIRQPLAAIKAHTKHDTHVLSNKDDGVVAGVALSHADVIVCRPGVNIEHTKKTFATMLERLGKELKQDLKLKGKWVLDIDDNTELISPYSIHFSEYGQFEFFDKNLNKWLWKDGENNFDLQRNKYRVAEHLDSMRAADLVTVTTEKLAEYARGYNKNVAVLPNSLNFNRWWKLPFKPNKQLRVGWSGGYSHYEDWVTIQKPLNKLMREFQFKLVSAGQGFPGLIDDDNKHLFESHDWVPFKGHSYRMMCMNLDIAVIPLADLPFNHFKSPIKYLEMSAMGVPSVVANVSPYKEAITPDRAAPYSSPQEFEKQLRRLLTSPKERESLSSAAQDYAHTFDEVETAKLWVGAYEALLDSSK